MKNALIVFLFMFLCRAGMGGHYVLDEYGDRDANFSMIYTSRETHKVRQLTIQQFDFFLHHQNDCFA